MLNRKIFCNVVILTFVLLTTVSAQAKETLAVLDFKTEAVSQTEMNAIVEFLSAELFGTDKYIVIDVSQRETILQEMEFSMQGCSDDSCALEIGKMLSAELIVTGNLSKVGTRYLMSVKMLQTETSRTMGTANGKFKDLDELIDGLESIAFRLAGMEVAAKAEAEKLSPAPAPAPAPAPEPEPAIKIEDEDAEAAETPAEAETAELGIAAFSLSATGSLLHAVSGVFRSMAVSNQIAAQDAYELYMSIDENPGDYFLGDDGIDYEHYYGLYERDTIISMITAGVGGGCSAVSCFAGNLTLSTAGRVTYSAGTAAMAAADVLSSMAANTAVSNERLYDDYEASTVLSEELYNEYEYSHQTYSAQRYISYGLYGLGAVVQAGAYFMPGEKSWTPGVVSRIVSAAGSLLMAGGNFANVMAFRYRIEAEEAYDDYLTAINETFVSELWNTYENMHNQYEFQTYMSYGLWGAGAAAVIVSMLLPGSEAEAESAEVSSAEWYVIPSSTGLGVEVQISLR